MVRYLLLLLTISFNIFSSEHFSEYLELNSNNNKIYYYSDQALEDGIFINQFSELPLKNTNPEDNFINNSIFPVNLSCNHPVTVKEDFFTKKGKQLFFNVTTYKNDSFKVKLILKNNNTKCILTFQKDNGEKSNIEIIPYKNILPDINLTNENLTENEKGFFLDDGVDAINKRIEVLTGKKISRETILARDPKQQLDFSNMPKFDFVLFATLQFNNDYISNIMFKALAEHAKKGTPVTVLVNTRLIGEKEEKLLKRFQSESPNIKIMQYEYFPNSSKLGDKIDKIHRVSHVKILATYSKNNPELNQIISGGRNNSDRYFFQEFKKFNDPEYTQFDKEIANKWAQFYDMDFYLNSPKAVHSVLNQVLSFLKIKNSEKNLEEKFNETDYEFNISVPYASVEKTLEDHFVELIFSAKSKIKILTPYVYFTERIDKAFKDAANRGVEIQIITSASLLGDDMTKSVKGIYDKYASHKKNHIEFYSYTSDKNTVMHRKAMLIDDETLVLGSVNMSKRSFYHDIEITCNIKDKQMIENFNKIFELQLGSSHKATLENKAVFLNHLIDLFNSDDIL